MKTNLTQAITIHSAYGVEVEYYDGQIVTVGPTLREIPKQLELFNYLLEKGYNVFGLSSEFVKSKS